MLMIFVLIPLVQKCIWVAKSSLGINKVMMLLYFLGLKVVTLGIISSIHILKGVIVMTKPEAIKQNRKPNKLINEKSPYLLQHSYNPVNWNPWSEEAFAKAKAEDKPIFLSIGYSTCHWCHVN